MGKGNLSANVVIIGFGMGFNPKQYHCSIIETTKGLNLYGVCDIKPDRLKEAQKEYQIKTFVSFDEVLDDDNVDLVVIATPHNTHAPMAIKALDAGKHVVTEKIMCLNTQEADAMISASKRNQRLLSVRQNRRWDPDYLTVKKVIDDGILGDVFSIDSPLLTCILNPMTGERKKNWVEVISTIGVVISLTRSFYLQNQNRKRFLRF